MSVCTSGYTPCFSIQDQLGIAPRSWELRPNENDGLPRSMKKKAQTTLRSHEWLYSDDVASYAFRSYLKKMGIGDDCLDGRPVIGICNSWSELTPCNTNLRELAECVRRGVLEAGGLPLEFPVMSLGETNMRPTAMMYRNLASMDVEETIRANPIDGVVLLAGCDKTTPALLMGAASCDVPTIVVSAGPMLNGKWRGRNAGSGTSAFRWMEDVRAGKMTAEELRETEQCMSRSAGTCMTMGTASTMACLVEAMGLSLKHNGTLPAPDSRRLVLANASGKRIVEMVRTDVRLSSIVTRNALKNAVVTNSAIGGSTNAVVHLLALAGRIGLRLSLDNWDRWGAQVPCLLNLMPSGRYLMEDFCYAGGLAALMNEIGGQLDLDCMTVSGVPLKEQIKSDRIHSLDVIRPRTNPIVEAGGFAVVKGNLAPDGAVIKVSAASKELLRHQGPAVVFENIDDYASRIDDPALQVEPHSVLVLKNCGPIGFPGFPEVGNFAIPKKLIARGVRDMVRISDSRMSGTGYGTVVLHVAPEAAVGGNLALVQDGDIVSLNVAERTLSANVTDEDFAARRSGWRSLQPVTASGYERLFLKHVLQADEGCDFDFLKGCRGAKAPKSYLPPIRIKESHAN